MKASRVGSPGGALAHRLFVYGTLAPGQPNHSLLAGLSGTWQKGTVAGKLYPDGIGPTSGYPVVDLSQPEHEVPGDLLISSQLPDHWDRLDAFEGEGYRRVPANVTLANGQIVEAFLYALDRSLVWPDRDVKPG